jgi:hypothetical protein
MYGEKIWIKGEIKNAVGVEDPAVTIQEVAWQVPMTTSLQQNYCITPP